jgi:hypothetical protein
MRCSFPPSSFERSSFPHLLVVASVAVGLLVGCSGEASSPLPAARAAIDAAASERVAHAPRLVRQPESISAPEGSPALFVAEADGDPPIRWQWLRDGVPIAGADRSDLQIDAAQMADHGARYEVVAENAAGRVFSSPARLWVDRAGARQPWE